MGDISPHQAMPRIIEEVNEDLDDHSIDRDSVHGLKKQNKNNELDDKPSFHFRKDAPEFVPNQEKRNITKRKRYK